MNIKLLLLLLCISCSTFALQNINVNELMPVRIVVSQSDINLISLKDDRIESFALPTSVEVEQNTKNGSAFLKFKSANVVKGFLTSESGAKYQLEFVPSDVPAETIVLIKPGLDSKTQAADAREYTQMLANLLRAMHNNSELDGYVRLPLDKNIKYNNMKLKLIATYSGGAIDGLVYQFENSSNEVKTLKEIDFYASGVRGVALVDKALYSGDVTQVYIMRDKV